VLTSDYTQNLPGVTEFFLAMSKTTKRPLRIQCVPELSNALRWRGDLKESLESGPW
jgi:hypothetical protein